ncbi:MAG TPA: YbhB/YbcL family Raf kinase inhibitor-like protein, partial [Lysobacter sp.]
MAFQISSPAFEHNAGIPTRFTCEGDDVSPELRWSGVPEGTRSLALIVEDPDAPDPAAPKRVFVHWVLYNLPANSTGLAENIQTDRLPFGTKAGQNGWQRAGYGGPCPPIGRHRYFFKLYALGGTLGDLRTPVKADVEKAMRG